MCSPPTLDNVFSELQPNIHAHVAADNGFSSPADGRSLSFHHNSFGFDIHQCVEIHTLQSLAPHWTVSFYGSGEIHIPSLLDAHTGLTDAKDAPGPEGTGVHHTFPTRAKTEPFRLSNSSKQRNVSAQKRVSRCYCSINIHEHSIKSCLPQGVMSTFWRSLNLEQTFLDLPFMNLSPSRNFLWDPRYTST